MKITLNIKNFKLLSDISEEFRSGYLYLVKGRNAVGKTSFWQSIRMVLKVDNPNTNILQFGAKEGFVEIDIEKETEVIGADGNKYIAKCEFKDGKEDKFTLIMPDTTVRKSKKDIRNIFQYNDFTVEEFLGWGLTESGRRKQAETILEFLPDKIKNRISEIDQQINIKSGTLYVTRSGKNDTYQGFKKVYEQTLPLTADEEKILSNEVKTTETIESIKKDLDALQLILQGNNKNIQIKSDLTSFISTYKLEKQRIEKRLLELNDLIKDSENGLNRLPDTNFDQEKYDNLKIRYDKGIDYLNSIKVIRNKEESITLNEQRMINAQNEWEKLNEKVESLRLEKKSLFEKAKLPMDNVIIDDGELFFVDDKDNRLAFTEEQVSYSLAGKRIAKLLLERNKSLPIICIGKSAEYDEKSLKEISDLAKEYDAIIYADMVIQNQEELSIEVYQE